MENLQNFKHKLVTAIKKTGTNMSLIYRPARHHQMARRSTDRGMGRAGIVQRRSSPALVGTASL